MSGRTAQPLGREVLGRYQLVERVAVGGMAELYLARVTGPGGFAKNVAVKRVLPQLAESDEMFDMLLDEARIAATLQHPNLVQVYDVCEENGEFFIAMEFLDGIDLQSLRRLLDRRNIPLPWEIALFIVTSIASGLQYAHDKTDIDGAPLGIVHRDVTPHNIFLTRNGGVKLVDFGIAKAANRLARTNSGTVKGKVPYMSPEQCLGQPLDHRADIFSLGILLYELTTRRRLYDQRSEYLLMRQIVEGDIVPPSEIMTYAPELEAVVLRALAKAPEERFSTAREFQSQLEYYAQTCNLRLSALSLQNFLRPVLSDYEASQARPPMAEGSNRARLEHALGTLVPPLGSHPDHHDGGPIVSSRAVPKRETPAEENSSIDARFDSGPAVRAEASRVDSFASLPWSAGSQPNPQRTTLPPPPCPHSAAGSPPAAPNNDRPKRRRAGDRSLLGRTSEAPNRTTSASNEVLANDVAADGAALAVATPQPTDGVHHTENTEAESDLTKPNPKESGIPLPFGAATAAPGREENSPSHVVAAETVPVAEMDPFADLPSLARAAIADALFDEDSETAPVDPAVLHALAEAEPVAWQPEAQSRNLAHTFPERGRLKQRLSTRLA